MAKCEFEGRKNYTHMYTNDGQCSHTLNVALAGAREFVHCCKILTQGWRLLAGCSRGKETGVLLDKSLFYDSDPNNLLINYLVFITKPYN